MLQGKALVFSVFYSQRETILNPGTLDLVIIGRGRLLLAFLCRMGIKLLFPMDLEPTQTA
jgi:hypothetical protein